MSQSTSTTRISIIDFCRENQIPYFYLTIKYITDKDGKIKKQVSRLPKGYMTMTYTQALAIPKPTGATHINIILKNAPTKKLIVIDTDSVSAYQTIIDMPEINETAMTTNTARPGHAHFYYEVDKLPAKKIIKTSDAQDMDLIIDNIFETIDATFDKTLFHTKLDTIMAIFNPKIPISDSSSSLRKTKTIKQAVPNHEKAKTSTINDTTEPQILPDIQTIEKMVNGLKPKEFEPYAEWIKLAYCLYNISQNDLVNKDKYFEIFNNFLKGCTNYNQGQNQYFFYTQVHMPIPEKDQIKIGSLHRWLKLQNPELHNELFTEVINDPIIGDINPMYFNTKYKNNYKAAKQYFEQIYFKLNNPACFCYYDNIDDQYIFKSEDEMKHITCNFLINDPLIPDKTIKFFYKWKDDPSMKYYSTIKLVPPPLVCNSNTLNLFTGFVADKLTNCQIADITPIKNHITLLCEDNPEYAEYVINFLAHIVQRPAELTRTALVFKGAQGAGKGLFFSWFANRILGAQYYYSTADPDNIIKYNDHLNGKLLINLDEARAADTYAGSSHFKNKITEPRITLTNKYIKPFEVENYGRYIFFSNQDNPVKVEDTDRRYVIFKTSEKYAKLTPGDPIKVDYFNSLRRAMDDPNVVFSFIQYLREVNITDVNWEDRPLTESYKLSRELNIPIFAEFIEKYCFETDNITFTNNITRTIKAHFFVEFNKFLERTKNSSLTMKERTFYIECKKYSFISQTQGNENRIRMFIINRALAFEYLKTNRFLQNNPDEYQL